MTYRPDMEAADSGQDDSSSTDLTGRDRMVWNVLTNWGGHFVHIVAGFVLPRMIDGHMGQDALGVWDFAWSLVIYFSLAQGGLISSVNHYVAKCRATGDSQGVNRVVSSASCVLVVMAVVVLALTVSATFAMPRLLGDQLGEYGADAQWVVFLLGTSIAVGTALAGFGGVLTGCHRWDLQNAVDAGTYLASVVAMILALVLGGGLPHLALMYLVGHVLGRGLRCVLSYRVYPGLSVRPSLARWTTVRNMLAFGGKSLIPNLADLLLNQTAIVLIIFYMGPASVALYARPSGLIRHIRTLVQKLAFVLVPTASSLQAQGKTEQLGELLIKSSRYGAYLALPLLIVLVVFGDIILEIWMGPTYRQGLLLLILAVGNLAPIIQQTTRRVLVGMNAHGWPGVAHLVGAICAVVAMVVVLGSSSAGLIGVALCVTIPITLTNGLYWPLNACRRLGLRISTYLVSSLASPILCVIPFTLCLVACRILLADSPRASLLYGLASGTMVSCLPYYRFALPSSIRIGISRRIAGSRNRQGPKNR